MTHTSEEVDQFIKNLTHPRKKEVEEVRSIILGAHKEVTEHIKWNAPSFCYKGDDRITFRLQPKDRVELIFHRGARVKDSSAFKFADGSGLVRWIAQDRGIVSFESMEDVQAKKVALTSLAVSWLKATAL